MLRHHPETFAVYLPVILSVIAVPTMIATARRRWRDPVASGTTAGRSATRYDRAFILLGLLALSVIFFAKGWVHVSVNHMAMAVVSSIVVAGIAARSAWQSGRTGRLAVGAALAPLFVFTLLWCYTDLTEAARNVVWAVDPASWRQPAAPVPPAAGTCRMPAGLERLACFRVDPAEAETVRYIQQRTTPDDPVFVGLSRHDKVFISDVMFYFAVNRPSATKWYETNSGLQTTEPIQREMIHELEQTKPKLIVIEDIWADWREPNESAISSGVTLLDDYIHRAFEPVASFGVNTVLRPRSAGPP
jgi:hypothetical protein